MAQDREMPIPRKANRVILIIVVCVTIFVFRATMIPVSNEFKIPFKYIDSLFIIHEYATSLCKKYFLIKHYLPIEEGSHLLKEFCEVITKNVDLNPELALIRDFDEYLSNLRCLNRNLTLFTYLASVLHSDDIAFKSKIYQYEILIDKSNDGKYYYITSLIGNESTATSNYLSILTSMEDNHYFQNIAGIPYDPYARYAPHKGSAYIMTRIPASLE